MRFIPALLAFACLSVCQARSTSYVVRPDGTGDFPTIQAAIDAVAEGDIIELADGIFAGPGNVNCDYAGKAITIRSQSGNPAVCVIDCSTSYPSRGFVFRTAETPLAVLAGVTITHGTGSSMDPGGGIHCSNQASPRIENCVISNHFAEDVSGAGVYCRNAGPLLSHCTIADNFIGGWLHTGAGLYSYDGCPILDHCVFSGNISGMYHGGASVEYGSAVFDHCLFVDNMADWDGYGGALGCRLASVELSHCTFVLNSAYWGGSAIRLQGAHLTAENTLIAFNRYSEQSASIYCSPVSVVTLTCCNIFGNVEGDWVDQIADQLGVNGNISENPLFCEPAAGNFALMEDSPCASSAQPGCGYIGAFDAQCPSQHILVRPDGTGDYPTIQAAIDATVGAGEIIELADGVFTGDGNRDLVTYAKAVVIRSRSGDPEACVIDCQGAPGDGHRGLQFEGGIGPANVLEGFTIANGYIESGWFYDAGGGICCGQSSPVFRNLILRGNHCTLHGGGMFCYGGSPQLENVVFEDNSADGPGGGWCSRSSRAVLRTCTFLENSSTAGAGGGLCCELGEVSLTSCTLAANAAGSGGGMAVDQSEVELESSVIAFSAEGSAVAWDEAAGGNVALACCDLFGNAGGDWTGAIAGQAGVFGNIAEDPLFCDLGGGNLRLQPGSPCAPQSPPNPECDLIGAWAVGCDPGSVPEALAGPMPVLRLANPQPAAGPVRIVLAIPPLAADLPARVTIHDAAGRTVRTLLDEVVAGGEHHLVWDGRDARQHPVGGGLYLCRARWGGMRASTRVVLLN